MRLQCECGHTFDTDELKIHSHRVLAGDSTKAEDVERVMGGEKVDNAFTSPPYAEQQQEQYGGIPFDEYVAWWEPLQENIETALDGNGSFFVNIKEHCEDGERVLYVRDLVLAMKREWNWCFVDELVWFKKTVPPGAWEFRFKCAWEPIFHFAIGDIKPIRHKVVGAELKQSSRDRAKYAPSGKSGTGSPFISTQSCFETDYARASNVIELAPASSENAGIEHPAMYPIKLPGFFMRAFSDEGDIWIDPFLGSGTTLIAADQLNRKCYGLEISPRYVDVIVKRYINHAGTSDDVFVERDGERMSWDEAQHLVIAGQKVHAC